eukprot:1139214-Pelagomonas_calceolata.AAC.2
MSPEPVTLKPMLLGATANLEASQATPLIHWPDDALAVPQHTTQCHNIQQDEKIKGHEQTKQQTDKWRFQSLMKADSTP